VAPRRRNPLRHPRPRRGARYRRGRAVCRHLAPAHIRRNYQPRRHRLRDWRPTAPAPGPPAVRQWTGNIVNDGGHATFHLTSVTGAEAEEPSTSRPTPAASQAAPLSLTLAPTTYSSSTANSQACADPTAARKTPPAPPHPVSTAGREPPRRTSSQAGQYPAKPPNIQPSRPNL